MSILYIFMCRWESRRNEWWWHVRLFIWECQVWSLFLCLSVYLCVYLSFLLTLFLSVLFVLCNLWTLNTMGPVKDWFLDVSSFPKFSMYEQVKVFYVYVITSSECQSFIFNIISCFMWKMILNNMNYINFVFKGLFNYVPYWSYNNLFTKSVLCQWLGIQI